MYAPVEFKFFMGIGVTNATTQPVQALRQRILAPPRRKKWQNPTGCNLFSRYLFFSMWRVEENAPSVSPNRPSRNR